MTHIADGDYAALWQKVDNSGFGRTLGRKLLELRQGHAVVSMRADESFESWVGRTHGGAIMALADQALSAASGTIPGTPIAIQFNINFLSSAGKGEEVIATARQVHVGRRVAVFDFEVRDRENRLLAQGQATGLCKQEAR